MRTLDLMKRAGRSLRAAKIRTLLTALAIAVGGFTLCLTLAAGNGVRKYTDDLVQSNFDPAELLVGRDPEVSNTSSPSDKPKEYDATVTSFQGPGGEGGFQLKQVTRADIDSLKKLPEVEEVRETYTVAIRYITREGFEDKKYTGSVEAYNPAQKPEIQFGALPQSGDIAEGEILLPSTYLSALGFEDEASAVGQKIIIVLEKSVSASTILNQLQEAEQSGASISELAAQSASLLETEPVAFTYTISGVTKKPVTSLSFGVEPLLVSSVDAKTMYEVTTEGTQNYDQFVFVSVRVKDGANKEVRDAVKSKLETDGYYVLSSEDIQKTITQFVDILQGMVGALGSITLIASIFGIVNTQYISVLERTREIGLMKALGMSKKNISRLFIFEATWIGGIGGALGIIFGLIVGTVLNPIITKALDLGDGNHLIIFNALQLFVLLLALMLVGAIAGLLPARKAAKLDPVEALRTE